MNIVTVTSAATLRSFGLAVIIIRLSEMNMSHSDDDAADDDDDR